VKNIIVMCCCILFFFPSIYALDILTPEADTVYNTTETSYDVPFSWESVSDSTYIVLVAEDEQFNDIVTNFSTTDTTLLNTLDTGYYYAYVQVYNVSNR